MPTLLEPASPPVAATSQLPALRRITPTPWLPCGEGTLLDPVTHRPVTLRVVEAAGWGRFLEIYDYSNEPQANFDFILHAANHHADLVTRLAGAEQALLRTGDRRGFVESELALIRETLAAATAA